MSTPRSIRQARRQKHDPWAVTVKGELDTLPPIEWSPAIPVGDATELPSEEGMQQFKLAEQLQLGSVYDNEESLEYFDRFIAGDRK